MTVSVVIPAYNAVRFIKAAIDSVLAQTVCANEIVVVDDGSTDDTASLVRQFGGTVRLVQQENSGLSASRNRGASIAAGDLIAFLDADDAWLPEKLDLQLMAFKKDPETALCTCGIVQATETLEPMGQRLFTPSPNLVDRMLRMDANMVFGGSTMIVRRDVFEAIGGFDPRLSTSADWDFLGQIAVRQKVVVLPQPLVLYRLHGENMHRNVRLMEHDMRLAMSKLLGALNGQPSARLRRTSFSHLYALLGASYFAAHDYPSAVRCLSRSAMYHPGPPLRRTQAHLLRRFRGKPR